MSKKLLSLLLVLSMVFVLAACGEDTTTTTKAPDTTTDGGEDTTEPGGEDTTEPAGELEAYEITYYMYSTQPSNQDEVVEEALNAIITPKFNATVDFIMITGGDWEEKALVPLQAGEKIDVFWTPEWMHFMSNVNKNLLLPLDDPDSEYGDLINTYAPQTVEDLGAFIPANIVNGHLYTVPTNKELCVPGGLIWNQTYLEKYDIDADAVMTPEDLEPILADFAAAEPDVNPLLCAGGWSFADKFIQGFLNNMEPISMYIGEPGESQEPVYFWEDESTRERCLTMEKWYDAGYTDPDNYLSTFSNIDVLNAGDFLVSTDFVLKGGQVKANELMAQSGNPDLKLYEVQTSASVNVTTHAGGSMLGIPITSQDPARAMMYINEMHQNEELLNTMAWGVEGTHYTLNDDGYVLPEPNNGWSDSHGGMWTLGNQFKQLISANEDPNKYAQMAALTAEAWNHDSLGFRFQQAAVENEYAAIKNVTDTYSLSMRCGVNVTEEYDNFLAELKAAGVETVMAEVKAQWDAWKASK